MFFKVKMKLSLQNKMYNWAPVVKENIFNNFPFYYEHKSDIHIFYITSCDISKVYHHSDSYIKEIQFYASCYPESLQRLTRCAECKICSKLTFYICILPSSKIIRICSTCTSIKTKKIMLGQNTLFYNNIINNNTRDIVAGYYKNQFYHHKIIPSKKFLFENILKFKIKNDNLFIRPTKNINTTHINYKCRLCGIQLDLNVCIFCTNFSIKLYIAKNLDKYMIINSLFLSELAKIISKNIFLQKNNI